MNIIPAKILVAIDGSRDACLAVGTAVDISERAGAELHLVHVQREPQAPPLARSGLAYPSLEALSYLTTCPRANGRPRSC